jgi:hypothetical protein
MNSDVFVIALIMLYPSSYLEDAEGRLMVFETQEQALKCGEDRFGSHHGYGWAIQSAAKMREALNRTVAAATRSFLSIDMELKSE